MIHSGSIIGAGIPQVRTWSIFVHHNKWNPVNRVLGSWGGREC